MKTILVVDDEIGLTEALGAILSDEGYRVFVALNGREGLASIHENRPDLVLVDFMMPIVSGPQMIRALRDSPEHRTLPVVVMSSATESTVRAECRDIQGFLRKPFALDKLLALVKARTETRSSDLP